MNRLKLICILSALFILLNGFFNTAVAEIHTVEGDGYYVIGDGPDENHSIAKERARMEAKRAASEKCGIFIESISEVKNGNLTKDDILSLAATVLKIKDEDFTAEVLSGVVIRYHCHIMAEVDSSNITNKLLKDRKELYELKEQYVQQQKELESVNKELAVLKDKYRAATKEQQGQINRQVKENEEKFSVVQLSEKAIEYAQKGKYQEAIQYAEKAQSLNSHYVLPPAILSACYYRLHKYEDSLKHALKCIQVDPNNQVTYMVLCNAYYQVNDISNALIYCDKLIESSDTIAVSMGWAYKGRYYFDCSDYTKAIECFDNALAQNPDNVLGLVGMGFLNAGYYGKIDVAMDYFNRVLKIDPYNTEALAGTGIICYLKNDYDNAIKKCQEACDKDPNNYFLWFVLGGVYYNKQDYSNTIRCFEKVVELAPNIGRVWHALGCAYLYSFDYKKASECLSKAIELEPNNVTYKQHYQEAVQRGNI